MNEGRSLCRPLILERHEMRDIEMSTSQQFDGRWLVYYVGSGRVEIQGLKSNAQAIEYITTKPSGEFARFVYVPSCLENGKRKNFVQ